MAAAQGRARRGPHLHSLADSTTSESLHKGQRAPLGWPAMEGHWLRLSSEREQNNSWEPSLVIPNWFLSAKKSVRLAPPAAVEQRCGVSALADAKERKKRGERKKKRERGWMEDQCWVRSTEPVEGKDSTSGVEGQRTHQAATAAVQDADAPAIHILCSTSTRAEPVCRMEHGH